MVLVNANIVDNKNNINSILYFDYDDNLNKKSIFNILSSVFNIIEYEKIELIENYDNFQKEFKLKIILDDYLITDEEINNFIDKYKEIKKHLVF